MLRPGHALPALSLIGVLSPVATLALPMADGTVGTQVNPVAPNSVQIDGGTTTGQNLFHSFTSFDIDTGETVYFVSPADVSNIFSRVTGNSESTIDGVLGSLGSDATLFLMNPNGVVFGPNTRLDLEGSFMVTTADAVELGLDGLFSASAPNSDRLLSIDPSAFLFTGPGAPAPITNQFQTPNGGFLSLFNGLQVPPGETLWLLGGDITTNGGQISAINGQVEIAAIGEAGKVGFSSDMFVLPETLERADIVLTDRAMISVLGRGGGGAVLYGDDIKIADGSIIGTGTLLNLGSSDEPVGDIRVDATGVVTLTDGAVLSSLLLDDAIGGNIVVSAQDIQIINGSSIATSGTGVADVGDIVLKVSDTLSLSGTIPTNSLFGSVSSSIITSISSRSSDLNQGVAGDILIEAEYVELLDGAVVANNVLTGSGTAGNIYIVTGSLNAFEGSQITNLTAGKGDAGNVLIEADGHVVFDGIATAGLPLSSGVNSRVDPTGQGNAGEIKITTGSLEITGGAAINASTFGQGNAGEIILIVQDHTQLDGTDDSGLFSSTIVSAVEPSAQGNAGNIQLTTNTLEVTNGALLTSSSSGNGDAGDVLVKAQGNVVFDGIDDIGLLFTRSGASSEIGQGGQGNAGDVRISTSGNLEVTNGAVLASSTAGIGNAGDVIIQAQGDVIFDGADANRALVSTVASQVREGAQGNGGNIEIVAYSLEVTNGAQILASTLSTGDAGSVLINAQDQVTFDGTDSLTQLRSSASSEVGVGAQGNAGDIRVTTGDLIVANGAALASSTAGVGDAGDVIISARDRVIFDGADATGERPSSVTSQTFQNAEGNGGDVNISAYTLEVINGAQLTASTAGMGDAGDVIIVLTDQALLDNGGIFVSSDSDSQAGEINLTASNLLLDDNSVLSAESATVDGGNIFLTLDELLLLRNNSLITATAGTAQGAGDGGNIDIAARYIIAIPAENSDIIANAFEGDGGRVNITAQGVFGIEPRPELTPLSDITASSEQGVSGIVVLNSPDDSFIENSLTELPDTLTDPDTLVANSCVNRGQQAGGGTFITTGSGGLPESPADSETAPYATGDIQSVVSESDLSPLWQSGDAIVEPSRIYRTADGRLVMGRECLY